MASPRGIVVILVLLRKTAAASAAGALVAGVATLVPALRAARVDPLVVLRSG